MSSANRRIVEVEPAESNKFAAKLTMNLARNADLVPRIRDSVHKPLVIGDLHVIEHLRRM
jgi:hypothetical protein